MSNELVLRPASAELTNALVAVTGPSGSGKSYGALLLAHGLGKKIVVVDTELRPNRRGELRGRSETYAGTVALDGSGVRLSFSVIALPPPWTIPRYLSALHKAWSAGAEVVVVDSMSHEWVGMLERVDQLKRNARNQMSAWQTATPEHQAFIDALVSAPSHMVATIRSKMTTAEVEENGKKTFKKVGFQPIQRDGVEYEFEVIFDVDLEHRAWCSKANAGYARELNDFMASPKGGRLTVELGRRLKGWLDGVQPEARVVEAPQSIAPPSRAITAEDKPVSRALTAIREGGSVVVEAKVEQPGSVAAGMGVQPGSHPLAPDPTPTPAHGTTVEEKGPPRLNLTSDPIDPPFTVEEIADLVGLTEDNRDVASKIVAATKVPDSEARDETLYAKNLLSGCGAWSKDELVALFKKGGATFRKNGSLAPMTARQIVTVWRLAAASVPS